jgi:hypothetical protein
MQSTMNNQINGSAGADAAQRKTCVARPFATCVAAIVSITLGVAAGFMVPVGVPQLSAVVAASSSPSNAAPHARKLLPHYGTRAIAVEAPDFLF